MFLQLALLPLLGHKDAIDTLDYPIASKLGGLVSIWTFQAVDGQFDDLQLMLPEI